MEQLLFFLMALISLVGATVVIFSRSFFQNLLGLLVVLFGLGVLFFLLNRPFLGLFLMVFFGGGTSGAFVFAILLCSQSSGETFLRLDAVNFFIFLQVLLLGLLLLLIFLKLSYAPGLPGDFAFSLAGGGALQFTAELAAQNYFAVFSLLALLLVVTLVGSIYLLDFSGEE